MKQLHNFKITFCIGLGDSSQYERLKGILLSQKAILNRESVVMFCSSIMLEETGYDSWRKIENEKKKSETKTNKKSGLAE